MYREGYALVVSGGVASVLGLIYWIVAAHSYTPQVVGLNSAMISVMTLLIGISQMNLASTLVRFVPTAGAATRRLVVTVYLVSLCTAALVTVIFFAGVEIWTPTLRVLRDSAGFVAAFTLATVAGAAFNLQHSLLTGLRRAVWVPVENAVFSVSKLGLLPVFARLLPLTGIFASWGAGLAVAILPTSALIFGRLIPDRMKFAPEGAGHLAWTQITTYAACDYVGGLCWLASTTLIPIFIFREAGAAANAYFSLSWVMVLPLYLVAGNMGSSLVVSAVHETGKLRSISYRMLRQTALLVVPLAVLLVVAAPYVLLVFGRDYSQHGTTLLRLLALATIPGMVNLIYINVARVRRRMSTVMTVMAAQSAMALGLTWVCFRLYGLVGVGLAWVLSQSIVALVVAVRAPFALPREA
jgi:O-antigen/teichoic acid export membrane protein